VAPDLQARVLQYAHESSQDMLAAAVTTGLNHATMSPFEPQAEITCDLEDQSGYKDILSAGLPQRLKGMEEYMPPHMSAHTRHQEACHFQNSEHCHPGLHMLSDVAKELPEDAKLEDSVDMDILGLVPPTARAFDSVEAEVREQLGDLSRTKQDTIVRILEGNKLTVFETRDRPRLAPHHQWDLDITEVEGARPVSGWPYPVSPQHLPELNR